MGREVGRDSGRSSDWRGTWCTTWLLGSNNHAQRGCYRIGNARRVVTPLHMIQTIESRLMDARGGGFTRQFAGSSCLPVNEFGSFSCNACLDQPSPCHKFCPEESNIVGIFHPPRPHCISKRLQEKSTSLAAWYWFTREVGTCLLISENSELAFWFSLAGSVVEQGRLESMNRHGCGRIPPR